MRRYLLVLAVAAMGIMAMAQTWPYVRTVGTVVDGEVLCYSGASGRFVRSTGSTNLPDYLGTLSIATGDVALILSKIGTNSHYTLDTTLTEFRINNGNTLTNIPVFVLMGTNHMNGVALNNLDFKFNGTDIEFTGEDNLGNHFLTTDLDGNMFSATNINGLILYSDGVADAGGGFIGVAATNDNGRSIILAPHESVSDYQAEMYPQFRLYHDTHKSTTSRGEAHLTVGTNANSKFEIRGGMTQVEYSRMNHDGSWTHQSNQTVLGYMAINRTLHAGGDVTFDQDLRVRTNATIGGSLDMDFGQVTNIESMLIKGVVGAHAFLDVDIQSFVVSDQAGANWFKLDLANGNIFLDGDNYK